MSSINGVGTGGVTPLPQADAASATPAATQSTPSSFDPMLFVGSGADAAKTPRAEALRALGLPPAKDTSAGVSTANFDAGTLRLQADKPFDFSEVSTIFLQFMLTYRASARLDRQSSLEGQVKQLLDGAQKTREAAQSNFNAAVAQGVTSIVGGVIQGVVGGFQLKNLTGMKQNIADRSAQLEPKPASSKPDLLDQINELDATPRSSTRSTSRLSVDLSADAGKPAAGAAANSKPDMIAQLEALESAGDPTAKAARSNRLGVDLSASSFSKDPHVAVLESKFSYLQQHSQFLNSMSQSFVGTVVEGPGKIYSAIQTKDASNAQAQAQEIEAQAKKFEASYATASDQAQATRDTFNKVLDMVAEIDRSRSETAKSISRI